VKKVIFIKGIKGFIGKNLFKQLKKEFNIIQFKFNFREKNFENNLRNILLNKKLDYFIYLSFIKKPKNYFDEIQNHDLPIMIAKFLEKNNPKCKFIYFSTLNIFLSNHKDEYILTKKKIEKKLKKLKNSIILRIPLILSKNIDGDKKKLSRFVNILPAISFIPYKGSNINYMELHIFIKYFISLIKKKLNHKFYNFISNKYIYLYKIAENLAEGKILIYLPTDLFFKKIFKNVSPAIKGINYEYCLKIKSDKLNLTKNIIIK
jgi:hypothetical protein